MTAIMEAGILDQFANEIAKIERIGPCARIVFTVPDLAYDDGRSPMERTAVAKIIVPVEALVRMARQIVEHAAQDGRAAPELLLQASARTTEAVQ